MSLNCRLDRYPTSFPAFSPTRTRLTDIRQYDVVTHDQSSPKSLAQSTALHGTLSEYIVTVEYNIFKIYFFGGRGGGG